MKRIAFLVCVLVLLISNTAEARRSRWNNGGNYSQPVQAAPAASNVKPAEVVQTSAVLPTSDDESSGEVKPVDYSTKTAQGVANRMAANNTVGHYGGNPGYEGCGCGSSPAAAYSICCYGNSGMATVDVGYARSANGMWYCCRRYR